MAQYNILTLKEIHQRLDERERDIYSPQATFSNHAVRRQSETVLEEGYRQGFGVDVDRILHSRAYTRYIDKTQVFYLIENDHITHRVLHVQLVSKIARTIGRFLGLNEDLIEAIALGHDIGHAPFGHDGEQFLSLQCRQHGIGHFLHNVQSVQFLDEVERKGTGWNLSLQVLDGILCHDGEIHNQRLEPVRGKTFDDHAREIREKKQQPETVLIPMTLEGCVVRMADTISYIGRDIEDAVRLNMIDRQELPEKSVERLGNTNGTIVYNLVTDVIHNSHGKPYVAFSTDVSDALKALKDFNLERIYRNPEVKTHFNTIGALFNNLFETYLQAIRSRDAHSVIFSSFLKDMSEEYRKRHSDEEIVRDFISGMTDKYFLRQCPKEMRPLSIVGVDAR